jgi:hypothetical protein
MCEVRNKVMCEYTPFLEKLRQMALKVLQMRLPLVLTWKN